MIFTMFMKFIISIALCYTIAKLATLIHELGHVFALSVTKLKLQLDDKVVKSIFIFGTYGKTFSGIYKYLADNKHNQEIQDSIKYNAKMGLVFEFCFLSILLIISTVYAQSIPTPFLNYCPSIFIFIILSIVLTIKDIKKGISDIMFYHDPESFEYKENRPNIDLRYVIVPIGVSCISAALGLVVPCVLNFLHSLILPL